MSDAGRLVTVSALEPAALERARSMYESSFPASERAPFRHLVDHRPDERCQVLVADAGAPVGLALVRDLTGTSWTFLRYLVVSREQRGAGLGSAVWRLLVDDLRGRGRSVLAFDVEDPDDPAAPAAETEQRRRRVRFYERLGAALLPVEGYDPPAHGEGEELPPPLRLMAARLDGDRPFAADELAELIRAVYRHRYLVKDEERITATLLASRLPVGRGAGHPE